ncbi:MAG: hypothetical protein J6O41_07125, partial [Clostridia bacterium]|nr:hypothetical protein [Clostridia bacterium]
PCLAKEWAKQSDNSYLVKLRENVKWSDGQRFTAEDVNFTIAKLKENPSIYSYNVQNVINVDIIDDYTVKINLDAEVPFFEYYLTFPILSRDYYESEDFANTDKNNAPVCTGKFKIADAESSYITLEKNTSWWNKEKDVTLEKITINIYSSIGELYNSFKMGGLDLISTTNPNLQDYIGTMGYSSKELKGREHTFLSLNVCNYFLSKEEVRKAISYAIDKENIVSNIFNNKCLTSSFPLDYGSWLPETNDPSAGYNVEQARQLLTNNGWTLRSGSWQKTENYRTQRLALNLLVKASDASKVSVAENIKAQLASLGIIINIVQASDVDYNANLAARNYDIALCTATLSTSPNLNTFFGDGNLSNYMTEEIVNIMNEVKNTTDENILKERYQRLMDIYKNNVPYISLYNNKYFVAYNSALVGDINPTWFNQFYGVESWYK